MLFRIEVLGGFALYADGKSEPSPVRSYSRIYALLALHQADGISRRQILQSLWPDLSPQVAANRLRVALSEFRKELGPALLEWDGMVQLNPQFVSVDLHELTSRLTSNRDEVDEEFEVSNLQNELKQLSKLLLPTIEEPWVEDHQRLWSQTALQALRRLTELAWKTNNPMLAVSSAEAAFNHDPFDEFHWQAYLRARSMLGDAAEALRAFGQAQRNLRATIDSEFSEDTLDVASGLKLGRFNQLAQPAEAFNQREAEYLSKLFSKAVQTNPEAAMALLGIAGSGIDHINFSDVSTPILEALVKGSTSKSENWQRTLFNLVVVKSALNDTATVLEYGPMLVKETSDLQMLSSTMTYMAFAHLQLRQYSRGIQIINEGIELMENAGHGKEAFQLYTNKASLMWHQGHFEEALRLYEVSDEAASFTGGDASQRIGGVNACNKGLVHLMKGTPDRGLVYLEEALDTLTRIGLESNFPLLLPPTGYARYIVENDPSGIDLIIQGLKIAYRIGHVRGQQITLDFVAGVLAKAGRTQLAVEVLAYAKGWRESTAHEFSIAEQMFVDRILDLCGTDDLDQVNVGELPPRSVLNKVIQELRVISRLMLAS